jgi:two-component system, chemotaxis family, protein-glutamate methylesterase/glutaminase
MPNRELRVLVVDDTVVYRRILREVADGLPGATVAATAANGKLALAKMKRDPVDLVLLDVEMPEMGGLETLEAIRRDYPDTGVIMVSGVNKNSADITMKALEKGALDFVPKPEGRDPGDSRNVLIEQLRPLVQLFSTKRNLRAAREERVSGVREDRPSSERPAAALREAPRVERPEPPVSRIAPLPKRIDVLAIGVSTGGPNALAQVIPGLPANLGVPIVLVQHMPPLFTKSLSDSLDRKSNVTVREAVDGEPLDPNTVLVAPGGKHMVVRRKSSEGAGEGCFHAGLNTNPPENSCRPSVDVLFRSVVANYGGNILAVIMTGMGADGCEGVRAMKRRGCYCMTQSEASCVVYGMPQAVDEAGLSDERVPLAELANRITTLVRNPVTGR